LKHRLFLLACAAVFLAACDSGASTIRTTVVAAPSEPGIQVTIDTSHYTIGGSTEAELRAEMNRRGPYGGDAYARWFVHWSYPTEAVSNACDTGPIEVSVSVEYMLPEWTPPVNADRALIDKWNRYVAALQLHEDGHRDFGIGAAKDVLLALGALPPYPTCDDLNRAANTAANAVLDRYRVQELAYDRTTSHGATQGARFP